mmetsp:Transcript_67564/g.121802  ORF Transcript_67564/g.121802 Transcript_67564/m.121802 type:complete len:484 (-) Transcript_67564:65-1516(-)
MQERDDQPLTLGATSRDLKSYQTISMPDQKAEKSTRWAQATSFQLVYSMVNTGMALCILPLEADRLNEGNGSIWVGIYLVICGSTQLICPLAGKISDLHESEWGRRRPFIVAGTFAAIMSLAIIQAASANLWPITFMVGLLFAQISLNVVFAVQCGLPADIQSGVWGPRDPVKGRECTGIVSGYVAAHSFIGSLSAVAVVVAAQGMPLQVQYTCFMACLAIVCTLVCCSVQEESTVYLAGRPVPPRPEVPKMSIAEMIMGSFYLDLDGDRDFFWVCFGRCFYYVSTSVAVFLLYYIRDMLHVSDEDELRTKLATLIVTAQLVGALVTLPAGRASNAFGRKPVLYVACCMMAFTFLLWIMAPTLSPEHRWPMVLFAGVSYGVGSGSYLSVDYALAMDCLPKGKSYAEAFGLWGVAGFFGSTVGPMIGGFILASTQIDSSDGKPTKEGHYGYIGYALDMFVLGVVMNSVVIWATSRIQATAAQAQ